MACAARLAERHWSLILCDVNASKLAELADSASYQLGQVEILAGDIADPSFPSRLNALIKDRKLNAFVHTAGLSPTMADSARILAVNFDATVRLVRVARPRMAVGGCAVLIASSAGHQMDFAEFNTAIAEVVGGDDASALLVHSPTAGHAYALSKRAVQKLVEREAVAFGKLGARIVSVSPGQIDTPMARAELKAHPMMRAALSKSPLGRLGQAGEIASVVAFLCSPEASFVSGCDIKVDGGLLAALDS